MAILIFQHEAKAGAGRLAATLRDHGFALEFAMPHEARSRTNRGVPGDLDGVQGLIVLGGPQNVTDIGTLAWMQEEAAYIKAAHAREIPIVGICLGAQLLAHALGGEVAPRATPLLGFDTVSLTPAGQTETMLAGIAWQHPQFFACGQGVTKLPPGATLLAGTKTTPVQAFKAGVRSYGFMYHFECDRPMLESLAGAEARNVASQAEAHYAAYARLSDRLAVNIATYCFPVTKKLAV